MKIIIRIAVMGSKNWAEFLACHDSIEKLWVKTRDAVLELYPNLPRSSLVSFEGWLRYQIASSEDLDYKALGRALADQLKRIPIKLSAQKIYEHCCDGLEDSQIEALLIGYFNRVLEHCAEKMLLPSWETLCNQEKLFNFISDQDRWDQILKKRMESPGEEIDFVAKVDDDKREETIKDRIARLARLYHPIFLQLRELRACNAQFRAACHATHSNTRATQSVAINWELMQSFDLEKTFEGGTRFANVLFRTSRPLVDLHDLYQRYRVFLKVSAEKEGGESMSVTKKMDNLMKIVYFLRGYQSRVVEILQTQRPSISPGAALLHDFNARFQRGGVSRDAISVEEPASMRPRSN